MALLYATIILLLENNRDTHTQLQWHTSRKWNMIYELHHFQLHEWPVQFEGVSVIINDLRASILKSEQIWPQHQLQWSEVMHF